MTHATREGIKKRRFEGKIPDYLSEKDKERLLSLLKYIGLGASRGDLFDNFVGDGWGDRYFYVIRNYAGEKNLINIPSRGEITLTEKGRKYVKKHLPLYSLEKEKKIEPRLEIEVDHGEKGEIVIEYNHEGKEMTDFDKLEELSILYTSYLLSADPFRWLVGAVPGDIERYEPSGEWKISYDLPMDKEVFSVFRKMLEFYEEKSEAPSDQVFPPWFIAKNQFKPPRQSEKEKSWVERYTEYWDELKEKAEGEVNEKRRKKVEEMEDEELKEWDPKKFEREALDAEKYIPKWLLESLEKPSVREWIERKLEDDVNFFMPRWFWERIGFREIVEGRYPKTNPSHPYDISVKFPPFISFFFELKRDLMSVFEKSRKYEVREIPEVLGDTQFEYRCWCTANVLLDYKDEEEFYLAFLRIQKELEEKGEEGKSKMLKPIEDAFFRENEEKEVRIASVYFDLSADSKFRGSLEDIEEAREKIKNGDYDKKETKEKESSGLI